MAPFTVVADGVPVGMTTFMNIDAANRRVEIGSTWLGPAVQGTGVNAEAKLLLLTRAFEDLDCIAVEFRTHFHNFQSRAAIERLGAKPDGVLRSHQLIGGVLLVLGLGTRVVGAVFALVMLGALFTVHLPAGFFAADGGYELVLLLAAVGVSLAVSGGGAWSGDAVIAGRQGAATAERREGAHAAA